MSTTPRAGEGLILEAHKETHPSLFPESFRASPAGFDLSFSLCCETV